MLRIIICGAGHVGVSLARYLTYYDTHLTVVDEDPDLIKHISNTLDVRGISGFPSHPEVLDRAGARQADMVISVTQMDEINMIACEVAHALFNVPTKIAQIRGRTYLNPKYDSMFREDNLSIDHALCPEVDTASSISNSLTIPGVNRILPLSTSGVKVVSISLTAQTEACHTDVEHLPSLCPEAQFSVPLLIRGQSPMIPRHETVLLPGDEIILICADEDLEKVIPLFSKHTSPPENVLIAGGGHIGSCIAHNIQNDKSLGVKRLTIIENDSHQALDLAEYIPNTTVICGSALDREILEEAGIESTDLAVTVTNDDKTNVLSALLSKNQGAKRSVSLVNDRSYSPLVTSLGIDGIINPRAITASQVLHKVHGDWMEKTYTFKEGFGELMEIKLQAGSPLIGKTPDDLYKKDLLFCGGIVRDDALILRNTEVFLEEDTLLIATHISEISELKSLVVPTP